ncbi:hypothetical protein Dimus_023292 [Dionaea muscipula]
MGELAKEKALRQNTAVRARPEDVDEGAWQISKGRTRPRSIKVLSLGLKLTLEHGQQLAVGFTPQEVKCALWALNDEKAPVIIGLAGCPCFLRSGLGWGELIFQLDAFPLMDEVVPLSLVDGLLTSLVLTFLCFDFAAGFVSSLMQVIVCVVVRVALMALFAVFCLCP